jgi:hypothetical protein
METLRNLFSILLLALIGLPLVSPLFAMTAMNGANLPACCRRSGKHHCAMSMSERNRFAATRTGFQGPLEKCPYRPALVTVAHHSQLGLSPAEAIFAGLISHPAVLIQTESKRRVARDRSRNKRGPPSLSTL